MASIKATSKESVTDGVVETITLWKVSLDGSTLGQMVEAIEYLESRGVPMNSLCEWRRSTFLIEQRTTQTPLKKLPKAFQ